MYAPITKYVRCQPKSCAMVRQQHSVVVGRGENSIEANMFPLCILTDQAMRLALPCVMILILCEINNQSSVTKRFATSLVFVFVNRVTQQYCMFAELWHSIMWYPCRRPSFCLFPCKKTFHDGLSTIYICSAKTTTVTGTTATNGNDCTFCGQWWVSFLTCCSLSPHIYGLTQMI